MAYQSRRMGLRHTQQLQGALHVHLIRAGVSICKADLRQSYTRSHTYTRTYTQRYTAQHGYGDYNGSTRSWSKLICISRHAYHSIFISRHGAVPWTLVDHGVVLPTRRIVHVARPHSIRRTRQKLGVYRAAPDLQTALTIRH